MTKPTYNPTCSTADFTFSSLSKLKVGTLTLYIMRTHWVMKQHWVWWKGGKDYQALFSLSGGSIRVQFVLFLCRTAERKGGKAFSLVEHISYASSHNEASAFINPHLNISCLFDLGETGTFSFSAVVVHSIPVQLLFLCRTAEQKGGGKVFSLVEHIYYAANHNEARAFIKPHLNISCLWFDKKKHKRYA